MKKILFAISTMALLLCACSKDDKDPAPIDKVTDGSEEIKSKLDEILDKENLFPSERENINTIGQILDLNDYRYIIGQRNHKAWISKLGADGKELSVFELPNLDNWKYSHYNNNSILLTNDNFALLRGWYTNVENPTGIIEHYKYQEHLSTVDMSNLKEIDKLDYQGETFKKDFSLKTYIENDRYLLFIESTYNPREQEKLHVIGYDGKIKYSIDWGENESLFFHGYLGFIYDKKNIMIFLTDEIVAPVTSSDNNKDFLNPYKIINLKKWELVKEIGETEGLKPQGDHLGEEDIFYKMDTTYLDGNNIKYVYSEKKIESDPISGVKQDRLLNKYYYNIDIDNYKVTYMGKVD